MAPTELPTGQNGGNVMPVSIPATVSMEIFQNHAKINLLDMFLDFWKNHLLSLSSLFIGSVVSGRRCGARLRFSGHPTMHVHCRRPRRLFHSVAERMDEEAVGPCCSCSARRP